jgi:hypothetical protein
MMNNMHILLTGIKVMKDSAVCWKITHLTYQRNLKVYRFDN